MTSLEESARLDLVSSDLQQASRAPAPAWWGWFGSVGLVSLATAVAFVLHRALQVPDPEMLLLLAIMLTAAGFGRGPALLASALSVASYNFFFVPPLFTFAVTDTRYVMTFAMMFGIGVVISELASRLRREEQGAREREADTRALFTLTRDLAQAPSVEALASSLCRHVAGACGGGAVLSLSQGGALARIAAWPADTRLDEQALALTQSAHLAQREATGTGVLVVPVGKASGVLSWLPKDGLFDPARRALLEAFGRQAALAIDRFQFSEAARTAVLKARTEELRSSLLSTVSHDLRTPLAVVTGAAQTLRDDRELDPATQRQLLDTICDEAERLERLVRNLLDMTRVQAGALTVRKEWVPVDELIGSARTRLGALLEGRELNVRESAEAPFLQVDPVLFEQVLFNLLDNAVKYTPAGSPLEVVVSQSAFGARIAVMDRGPGFGADEAERLFDKFVRGAQHGVAGAGLGLAICRGIVEAHGGHIHAEERTGGGASFVIELPIDGTPPEVPAE